MYMSMAFTSTQSLHDQIHRATNITSISPAIDADIDRRIDMRVAGRPLTTPELEACRNSIRHSVHSSIQVMPNHALDRAGRLQGFCFQCSDEDKSSILPMHEQCFEMSAVYEVCQDARGFNPNALQIIANLTESRRLMHELACELRNDNTAPATFENIGTQSTLEDPYAMNLMQDQKAWTESPPFKMGIYHTFSRAGSKSAERSHRVFIVVSGCLRHAAEQLYNLWQDTREHLSCRQFCESHEVSWLRNATIRNLHRIAHRIACRFGLHVQEMIDTEDPTNTKLMAIPSLMTTHHDIYSDSGKTFLTNAACLTERSGSGIIFDLFSSEGYWIYTGPSDHADYRLFGGMITSDESFPAFPTRTIAYNVHYPVTTRTNVVSVKPQDTPEVVTNESQTLDFWLPDEQFQTYTETLGFNRNDGIVPLIPIICFDQQ